jgi:hypothetical protein
LTAFQQRMFEEKNALLSALVMEQRSCDRPSSRPSGLKRIKSLSLGQMQLAKKWEPVLREKKEI